MDLLKIMTHIVTIQGEIKPEAEKLVIHNPLVGINYPPKSDGVFAVIEILGFQYKVV